ncbi:MAG: hypothetical protein Q7W51_02420 [Coriobacteriia bacterium]|nr:hypothetical protein [Coriobacteriia bacterium]
MAGCPSSAYCVFYKTIEPSIVKRVRYASIYSYCRGGEHAVCALYDKVATGLPVMHNLMPDGSIGEYLDEDRAVVHRFLVIEDSPVFAALAASVISSHFTGAQIVRKSTYDDAAEELADGMFSAVVCGFGLGGERTAHDVRRITTAPLVVLTGRPGKIDPPSGSRVVHKGAGPEALASALRACLA